MHADDPVLDLMDRFTAALNSHDLDAVMALVADDIVFEFTSPPPDGTRYEGRDAVRRIWAEILTATPRPGFPSKRGYCPGPKWPARRKPGLRQGLVHHHSGPERPAGRGLRLAPSPTAARFGGERVVLIGDREAGRGQHHPATGRKTAVPQLSDTRLLNTLSRNRHPVRIKVGTPAGRVLENRSIYSTQSTSGSAQIARLRRPWTRPSSGRRIHR